LRTCDNRRTISGTRAALSPPASSALRGFRDRRLDCSPLTYILGPAYQAWEVFLARHVGLAPLPAGAFTTDTCAHTGRCLAPTAHHCHACLPPHHTSRLPPACTCLTATPIHSFSLPARLQLPATPRALHYRCALHRLDRTIYKTTFSFPLLWTSWAIPSRSNAPWAWRIAFIRSVTRAAKTAEQALHWRVAERQRAAGARRTSVKMPAPLLLFKREHGTSLLTSPERGYLCRQHAITIWRWRQTTWWRTVRRVICDALGSFIGLLCVAVTGGQA